MNRLFPIFFALAARAWAGEPVELTQEDFKMYRHYQQAMDDPRVQKMKPEARKGAIARDAHFAPKALDHAISRAEAVGDIKARCESNIREALGGGDLSGRVGKVEVDI